MLIPKGTRSADNILQRIVNGIERQKHSSNPPAPPASPVNLLPAATGEPSVYWANFQIPLNLLTGHFLTVGGTGAGKTLLTDRQVKSLIPLCPKGSGNTLVYFDTKGTAVQLLEGEGCKDYILFNISDTRGWGWDIACDYGGSPPKLAEIAYKIAPPKKDGEPFFRDSSRSALKAILCSMSHIHPKWRLYWLYQLLQVPISQLDLENESFLEAQKGNLVFLQLLWRTLQPKTVAGILGELALLLDRLQPLFAHDAYAKKRFSLTELLEKGGVLVISMDLTLRDISEPAIHLLLDCLFDLVNARPDSEIKGKKGFLILDECPFLKTLPKLGSMLSFSRSKGWHVSLTAQSIEQLTDFYPPGEIASIIGNVDNLCLLKNNDPYMNRWISDYFGQEQRVERTISENLGGSGGYTESQKLEIRPRVLAGALAALPATSPKTGVYCYLNSPHFQEPQTCKFFIPAHDIARYAPRYDLTVPGFIPKPLSELIPPAPTQAELEYIVFGKRPKVVIHNVPQGIPPELIELVLEEVKRQAKGTLDQLIIELKRNPKK
ncbi:MAG: type IV secretory system conjugative DNA transfer family protein [Nodosilinea sp.]